MSRVRIAITGIGLVTPLGTGQEQTWQQVLKGSSAARWMSSEEIGAANINSDFHWYGAPVELTDTETKAAGQHLSRTARFAVISTAEAIRQAQLDSVALQSVACVIGTSKPDLRSIDSLFLNMNNDQVDQRDASFSMLYPSSPVDEVAARFAIEGPVLCPVAACATGLVSLVRAADFIQHGEVTCCIAGSADSSLHPGLLASYHRLGVLAPPGNDSSKACRPFDSNRKGFVVGEGASSLVLEEWDQAISRGATPLAEWVDGIIGCDPTGLTGVDSTGETLAALIDRLLTRNDVRPSQVSAISYHGTATQMNDLTEARAIQMTLGDGPLGFGVKGAIGHLLGAAGAVETAFGVLSLRDQVLPPTVNHISHDSSCPNRVTGNEAVHLPIEYLLKTSLGFGGHLAVGLLKRVETP